MTQTEGNGNSNRRQSQVKIAGTKESNRLTEAPGEGPEAVTSENKTTAAMTMMEGSSSSSRLSTKSSETKTTMKTKGNGNGDRKQPQDNQDSLRSGRRLQQQRRKPEVECR
jgi:hypothetical protein